MAIGASLDDQGRRRQVRAASCIPSTSGGAMAGDTPLRLPEDFERLVDPALVRRPEGLVTACYTFPHYHRSTLNDRLFGKGWTEYVLMRGSRPWFPGHHQPRTPLLGELDEVDPATWVTYVDLAVASGID